MSDDVLFKLSIAKQYAQHANFAGTPRQAVADGYSAVDAVFSALLIHLGQTPPRNHRQKLDTVRERLPDILKAERVSYGNSAIGYPGTTWESVLSFYTEWLASRYDDLSMSAGHAGARAQEANTIISCAVRLLARARGIDTWALEKTVSELAFGYQFSEISSAVGEVHERLFYEAERYGEMHGAKLGTKLAATTNYCSLDLISGDDLTQSILKEDVEVATEAAQLYDRFIKLLELIDTRRLSRISGGKAYNDCTKEEHDQVPDFMLSMKARYHGATIKETGERWGKMLAQMFAGRDGYGDPKDGIPRES